MVQILPLIGAAALLAQTVIGAAVPVKRTQYNNNYNQGNQDSNQYANGNYQAASYNSNSYNSGYQQQQNQDSYQNGRGGMNHETTTRTAEAVRETTVMMEHTTSSVMAHETTTSSAMAQETTVAAMHETTSTIAHETTTTQMAHETSEARAQETTTSAAHSMPTYGSGSSSWGNEGYNNCVSQCMAQFASPPSTMTMGNQESLPSATGTGAVHTVLVAPTGAGLRYMPFAVNATVGDTIRYVWTTPNNHTATLSSALAVCNKSGVAEQRNFVSGVRNASQGMQVFDIAVQTEEPQFFYCSVAQHCEKGMFGIINPGNNIGGANTVGTMMSSWLQSDPGLQAAYSYAMQNISSSSAKNWGMGISLDGIPESQYKEVARNILFTQANFAANPGMLETGLGATNPDGSPVMIVSDLNVLLSNTSGSPPTSAVTGTATAPAAATSSLTPVNATNAASKSTVGVWVAAVVGIAGWLLI